MPHQTEPNANNALAVVIRGMLPSCTVLPETTQVFPDHPGRHADVLITAQGSSPVAVEAEYDPAPEVSRMPVNAWGWWWPMNLGPSRPPSPFGIPRP